MTAQPYDPGPVPLSAAVMTAAAGAYQDSIDLDPARPMTALHRAVDAALQTATAEDYAVLVDQAVTVRTRQAEARLAKVTATAQAWVNGTPDQRRAGRMLLADLGHN